MKRLRKSKRPCSLNLETIKESPMMNADRMRAAHFQSFRNMMQMVQDIQKMEQTMRPLEEVKNETN